MKNIRISVEKRNAGDYNGALKKVKNALAIDSSKSFAYVLKGDIEACLGEDSIALKSFERALVLNPKNVSALYFKGLSYYQLDFNDSAIVCFTQAINAKKTEAGIIFNKNNEHLSIEDQFDVPDFEICYYRGLSYFYNNQDSLAVEDLLYALIGGYQAIRAQFYLGASYLKMGDRQMACYYWKRAEANGDVESKRMLETYCY